MMTSSATTKNKSLETHTSIPSFGKIYTTIRRYEGCSIRMTNRVLIIANSKFADEQLLNAGFYHQITVNRHEL